MRDFFKSFKLEYSKNAQYIIIFLLTISAYIFSINLLSFYYYDNFISENDEKLIFISSLSSIFTFSILIIFFYEFFRQKKFLNFKYFYPIITFINLIFLNFLLISLRLFSITKEKYNSFDFFIRAFDNQVPSLWSYSDSLGNFSSYDLNINYKFFFYFIIFVIFINCLILFFSNTLKKINFKKNSFSLSIILYCYPLLILIIFIHFSNYRFFGVFGDLDTLYIYGYWLIPICLFFSLISFFHNKIFSFLIEIKDNKFIYLILFLIIFFLVFDPNIPTEPFHQFHFLGPTADLRAGKTLLFDTDSMYGVFTFHILSLFFKLIPISLKSFTFLTMLLYFIQYLVTFLLLRFVTKSFYFSLIGITLIIILNFFTFYGPPLFYPGSGPIRFLPGILIIYFEFKSLNFKNTFNLYQLLILMIIGFASISGLDYLIFCFFTFLSMKLYKFFLNFKDKNEIINFLSFLFLSLFFIIFFNLIYALYVFLKTNSWPIYNLYFHHLFWYSDSEFMLPILPFGSWLLFLLLPISIIFIIFFKLIFKSFNHLNNELIIISGFTSLAILQFIYFLGRSHLENLYHINLPIYFIFLTIFYYLSKYYEYFTKLNFQIIIFCMYFILIFSILKISPNVYKAFFHDQNLSRIYNYSNSFTNLYEVFDPKTSSRKITDGITLVNKYSKNKNRIPIFLQSYENSEILMFTNKANILAYNFLPQTLRYSYVNWRDRSSENYDILIKYWDNEIAKIQSDDILYVNFKCDFYYNYDEIKPNINYGYTSFDYTVPCPSDDGAMHGRVKSIYDYFFTKIKSKYYLKIIETTKDGISAIKLEKKNI